MLVKIQIISYYGGTLAIPVLPLGLISLFDLVADWASKEEVDSTYIISNLFRDIFIIYRYGFDWETKDLGIDQRIH